MKLESKTTVHIQCTCIYTCVHTVSAMVFAEVDFYNVRTRKTRTEYKLGVAGADL